MTYHIEVDADSMDDLAEMLEAIAERISQGYTGGPGWRVDEADDDE